MISKSFRSVGTNMRMITLLSALLFFSISGFSQNSETIDLKEIPQRKVRKYILARSIDKMTDFSEIKPSWKKDADESTFNVIKNSFDLKYKPTNVWDFYSHTKLGKVWSGRSVRFGLLISKFTNAITYKKNISFPEVDTGQVYFLDIKLLKGLFNIPVAFEIINIDPLLQKVEFSYIDNNKAIGKQTIQFFDNGTGGTKIVHTSYFKSQSLLRDDIFYPIFHKKFIKEFHANMRRQIKNTELTVSLPE